MVHAAGREGRFDIPGIKAMGASIVLKSYETPQPVINQFIEQSVGSGSAVVVINDRQAFSISRGTVNSL